MSRRGHSVPPAGLRAAAHTCSAALLTLVMLAITLTGCNRPGNSTATKSQSQNKSSSGEGVSAGTNVAQHPWPTEYQNFQRTSCSPLPGPDVPELKWSAQLVPQQQPPSRSHFTSSPLVASAGTIYCHERWDTLHKVLPDGTVEWSVQIPRSDMGLSLNAEGRLLGGGLSGVFAVDSSGNVQTIHGVNSLLTRIPKVYMKTSEATTPLFDSSGNLIFAVSSYAEQALLSSQQQDYVMLCLDRGGNQVWQETLRDFAFGTQGLTPGGAVIVTTIFGDVHYLDPGANQRWASRGIISFTSGTAGIMGVVLPGNGTMLVYSRIHCTEVAALDYAGNQLWKRDFAPLNVTHVAAGPQGGSLVCMKESNSKRQEPDDLGALVSLDEDGDTIWRVDFSRDDYPRYLTVDSNGVVYFTSFNISEEKQAEVAAYNPDGTEKWRLGLPDAFLQVAIGENRCLYVYDWYGALHCIGEAD